MGACSSSELLVASPSSQAAGSAEYSAGCPPSAGARGARWAATTARSARTPPRGPMRRSRRRRVSAGSRRCRERSAARLERALDLAVGLALRDVSALVVTLLAAPDRHLHLGAAVLPVQP